MVSVCRLKSAVAVGCGSIAPSVRAEARVGSTASARSISLHVSNISSSPLAIPGLKARVCARDVKRKSGVRI